MTRERTTYTERSPWPGFASAALWGSVLLSCYPILAGWGIDLPFRYRWPIVAGIVAFSASMVWLVGGLTVRLQETRILLHLGTAPVFRKLVPYRDILGVEAVVYRPIREFGGWGVRGTGKRRAWTARGNQAVKLALSGDRELLVGTDHPLRLAERIRAAVREGRPAATEW